MTINSEIFWVKNPGTLPFTPKFSVEFFVPKKKLLRIIISVLIYPHLIISTVPWVAQPPGHGPSASSLGSTSSRAWPRKDICRPHSFRKHCPSEIPNQKSPESTGGCCNTIWMFQVPKYFVPIWKNGCNGWLFHSKNDNAPWFSTLMSNCQRREPHKRILASRNLADLETSHVDLSNEKTHLRQRIPKHFPNFILNTVNRH